MTIKLDEKQKELIRKRLEVIDFEIENNAGDKDYLHALLMNEERLERVLELGYIEI